MPLFEHLESRQNNVSLEMKFSVIGLWNHCLNEFTKTSQVETYSVDVFGLSAPFFVLVYPYPFNAMKRIWINQDVIDSPHCIFDLKKS